MRRAVWFVIAIVAMGSFSSLLSPFYWGFDLINHLRPQALVVSSVVFVLAVFCGRGVILAAGAVLAGNAVLFALPLVQAMSSPAPPQVADQTVRILSANVLSANRQHGRLLNLIDQAKPEIVLLTEINQRWVEAMEPLEANYPHSLLHPRQGNFGMAVYSKLHFDGTIYSNGAIRVPFAVLRFDGVTVFNAHPVPPVGGRRWRANKAYLDELAGQVDGLDGPVIVAGDLNTTIWGDAMKPLLDAEFRPLGALGLGYTWPVGNPLLRMQIDHVMGRGVAATDLVILPEIGSDHFPVLLDVVLE